MIIRSILGFIMYVVIMAVMLVTVLAGGIVFLLLTPFIGFPPHRRMQLKALLVRLHALPARYTV
mgnify:CR=1 FL=1